MILKALRWLANDDKGPRPLIITSADWFIVMWIAACLIGVPVALIAWLIAMLVGIVLGKFP